MRRPLLLVAVGLAAVALTAAGLGVREATSTASAHAAKLLCSLVFVGGQDPERMVREYVGPEVEPAADALRWHVDRASGMVAATVSGFAERRALYRPGLGCTLAHAAPAETLRAQLLEGAPLAAPAPQPTGAWPGGRGGAAPAAPETTRAAIDRAFEEPGGDAAIPRHTKAIVVAHRGRLVAERYAEGVTASTPLLSWSMAKSVTAAFYGAAEREGRIRRSDRPAPPAWTDGDPRGAITVDQLLRMSSGLAFEESYGPFRDATRMFYGQADFGAFAAGFPLAGAPGSLWSYSSGTTNLLMRVLRERLGGHVSDLQRWSRGFFDRVGMQSAVFEPDPSGTFVGSSYLWATARDWALFGELHRRDGVRRDDRILPEGWVRYVTTPTPGAPRGRYGAQWWLNAGEPDDPLDRDFPALPTDAYYAAGYSGQYVMVVPSAELVVVRLGLSGRGADHGVEELVATLIEDLAPAGGR